MNCRCFQTDDRPSFRSQNTGLSLNTINRQQSTQPKKSAPIAMKILDSLGLRSYILSKYVFRSQPAKYKLAPAITTLPLNANLVRLSSIKTKSKSLTFCMGENKDMVPVLEGYSITAELLQQNGLSVPVLYMKQDLTGDGQESRLTIVYSHGNSSDLADAFLFFTKFTKCVKVDVVIYDYTGYGASTIAQTTQKSLCADLQRILKWLKVPKHSIILWGFSLGTYPTISNAIHHHYAAVILQSPIASAACLLDDGHKQELDDHQHYTYDFDLLDNLANVGKITCQILILHSNSDEIIPISHSFKLYNIIKKQQKCQKFAMLETSHLKHNQMHTLLSDQKINSLNQIFRVFISRIKSKIANNYDVKYIVQKKVDRHGEKGVEKRIKLVSPKGKNRSSWIDVGNDNQKFDWDINEEQTASKTNIRNSREIQLNTKTQKSTNLNDLIGIKTHKLYFDMKNYSRDKYQISKQKSQKGQLKVTNQQKNNPKNQQRKQ